MAVCKASDRRIDIDTVLLEATLYKEDKLFKPVESYIFELVDGNNAPLIECPDIAHFKDAIAFFFNSILDTDLFVISIPDASVLCPTERKGYCYYPIAV